MRDPFANYDSWLERPYQDAIEQSEAFVDWCEEHNIDPDDPNAETLYLNYLDALWEPPEPDDDYEGDPYA